MRYLNLESAGTLPYARFLKIEPSSMGLLKYSFCWAERGIPLSVLSIISSLFLAGHVLLPSLSLMFMISQLLASSPARLTQQSLAMMLPHHITRVGSLMERVGYKASLNQSHFFLSVSGLRQSSSVSKSSAMSTSGRIASLRLPRGADPAPRARNLAPERVVKSRSVHDPKFICSPYSCLRRAFVSKFLR